MLCRVCCAGRSGSGLLQKELESARLKSALLSASTKSPGLKGEGLVTRQAAETVLLRQALFPNKVRHVSFATVTAC